MSADGASLEEIEHLYRSGYRRFVRMSAALTGDAERAHDAVQDAFASAIRHRKSYRGEGPLEAWLWRAVVNASLAARRRSEFAGPPVTSNVPANGGPPDRLLSTWISSLPERQRLVVFLRHYADLDYRAIAEALSIEVGTVSATLSAAHASLRRMLEEVPR